MPHPIYLIAPFLLGISGGLRAFTPAAIILIAVRIGLFSLDGTWLTLLSSTPVLVIVVALAIGELIGDKLPFTPARTEWLGLAGRVFSGAFCGSVLIATLSGNSLKGMAGGAFVGIIGAIAGAFGGFFARTQLRQKTGVPDIYIAIPEDIIAIGIAIFAISLSV